MWLWKKILHRLCIMGLSDWRTGTTDSKYDIKHSFLFCICFDAGWPSIPRHYSTNTWYFIMNYLGWRLLMIYDYLKSPTNSMGDNKNENRVRVPKEYGGKRVCCHKFSGSTIQQVSGKYGQAFINKYPRYGTTEYPRLIVPVLVYFFGVYLHKSYPRWNTVMLLQASEYLSTLSLVFLNMDQKYLLTC